MIARTRIFLFADLLAAATCGHAFPALAQIVALGASNIAGRGVGSSEVFPAQLERMLAAKGYNVYVANAGVNGDTNSGMLARLDQAVPDATRIVLLGTRGGSFNARRLGQGDQKGEFNAASQPRIKVLLVTGSCIGRKYLQPDGIHLSAEGHAVLAVQMLPSVIRALGH